jgi:hypothetical protein
MKLLFFAFILTISTLSATSLALECPYLQYHFNEGSGFTIFDSSANTHDATIYGYPTFEEGKLGLSLKLDAGQYFLTDTLTDTTFNYSNPFSVSFWFKNLEGGRMVLLARLGDWKGFGLGDYYGALTFAIWSNFDTNALFVATQDYGLLNDGYWHFVVYTYDGSGSTSGMKIYYDNSLLPVDIFSDNLNGDTYSNASFGSAFGEQQTYGYLDEMQIYDFELNGTQVRELYNFGNGTESNLCPAPPTPLPLYNGSADVSKYLTGYCLDSNTIKMNGTYQGKLVEATRACQYGCDSETNSCMPSPMMKNLFIGIGLCALVIIIFIALRISGRI